MIGGAGSESALGNDVGGELVFDIRDRAGRACAFSAAGPATDRSLASAAKLRSRYRDRDAPAASAPVAPATRVPRPWSLPPLVLGRPRKRPVHGCASKRAPAFTYRDLRLLTTISVGDCPLSQGRSRAPIEDAAGRPWRMSASLEERRSLSIGMHARIPINPTLLRCTSKRASKTRRNGVDYLSQANDLAEENPPTCP